MFCGLALCLCNCVNSSIRTWLKVLVSALVSRTSQGQQQRCRKAGAVVETRRICRVGAQQGHTQSGVAAYDRRQGELPFLEPFSHVRPTWDCVLVPKPKSRHNSWTLGVCDARRNLLIAAGPTTSACAAAASDTMSMTRTTRHIPFDRRGCRPRCGSRVRPRPQVGVRAAAGWRRMRRPHWRTRPWQPLSSSTPC